MVQTAFRGVAGPAKATAVADVGVAPQLIATTTLDTSDRFDPVEFLDSDAGLSDSLSWPEPALPFEPICDVIGAHSGEQPVAIPSGEVLSRPADTRFSGTFHFPSMDEPESTLIESEPELIEEPASLANREDHLEQFAEPSGFLPPSVDLGSSWDQSSEVREENSVHDSDYSKDHWPLLVGPARLRSFSRVRAAMVALTLVGSAAAFYFLVYQPMTHSSREAAPASSVTSDRTATGADSSTSAAAPASTDAQRSESTRPEEAHSAPVPKAEQPPAAGEGTPTLDTRGRFSLQAAAFPTQQGADEFAEKLKRAGLPSYVMSADMGRRGTWFRVRVGRFESAEGAKQYSAEALVRAKAAAGISLQLIVCQYEQQ